MTIKRKRLLAGNEVFVKLGTMRIFSWILYIIFINPQIK